MDKKEMIDLRSDTVTQPCDKMRGIMHQAPVGDDMFGEDPTVNELEQYAASLFGKDAGLFCSSGTQTNQIAIKVHTQPGDEVICSDHAHIYNYEGGGIAMNSGASVRLINGDKGRFTAEQVAANINADDQHYPKTRLVCAEDTVNRGGGVIWKLEELKRIASTCQSNDLSLHLDGARVFNSLTASGYDYHEYGANFDSISICLSKGLGAPVGSVLLGSHDFIARARRVRKVFGGAMRQAGIIAAGGLFALQNNVQDLAKDHENAKQIGGLLREVKGVKEVTDVETNIVIFSLSNPDRCREMLEELEKHSVLAFPISPTQIRFVFHRDLDPDKMDALKEVLRKV